MATTYFLGNAANVPQITTVTIANTWATADTATFTINGKDLVVTLGTPVTVTDVAALIVSAWNASTRIDSALGSSNVGGQTIPEFAEIIASNVAGVIAFTTRYARDTGKPFTITVAESTAGTGTVGSPSTTQAAASQKQWDNADNWSGGSVPANDDIAVFRDTDGDCLYGLPAASKQVQLYIYNTYTGRLGLPKVNKDNTNLPYYEYRPRMVQLDDAGTGTTIVHYIGIGPGPGPKLVNIRQDTLTTTWDIEANRADPGDGTKIVNVICAAGSTVKARKGSIDLSDQFSVAASVTSITVSGLKGQPTVDILSNGNSSTACTVNMVGGKLAIDWATWSTNGLTMVGAECSVNTCGIPSANVAEGTLYDLGNGTIAALTLNPAGVLDVSRGGGNIAITNANFYEGCKVVNPSKRITHTNPVQLYGQLAKIAPGLEYGYNRTLQVAG